MGTDLLSLRAPRLSARAHAMAASALGSGLVALAGGYPRFFEGTAFRVVLGLASLGAGALVLHVALGARTPPRAAAGAFGLSDAGVRTAMRACGIPVGTP
jgi:hypothetical protein